MESIRLLIVDDHPVVREGISAMMETQPDLQVVAEAANGLEAVQLAQEHHPDVVLMDLQMPVLDGVQAIRRIKEQCPEIQIIVLTTYDSDEYIFRGIEAGARGYLLKGATRDEVFSAVRAAKRGESLLQPIVASRLVERYTQLAKRSPDDEGLSDREMEVLRLMAEGARNKEIAGKLCVTEKTAKAHVSNILQKLNADDRTEAVTIALRKGIIKL
ncbi:MAG: response regulator transcription factor [Chloroflexota bacterium]|nr:MAG: response regulator transcription factor [Chloroflexota bacterium]